MHALNVVLPGAPLGGGATLSALARALPNPLSPARSVAVHKRFWRPQECLSLISAAQMDQRDAAMVRPKPLELC